MILVNRTGREDTKKEAENRHGGKIKGIESIKVAKGAPVVDAATLRNMTRRISLRYCQENNKERMKMP